tara:strand:+ start:1178 stop:1369 length:192 start_codon:yes stop_codon:yes gene_type:complete
MPFFKVRASSLEQFEAIIEAKDENEAYQIGKEDGGLFNSIDIWHGDWEIDPDIKQCTKDGVLL